MEGGTTYHFVTDGIEAALERARDAAGDQNVSISGGLDVLNQHLAHLVYRALIGRLPAHRH
jgi:dihydrofolate reductase